MDRPIAKKTWTTQRILSILGLLALGVIIYMAVRSSSGKSKLNVDTERLMISEVVEGPFKEFIPINGVVMPITTIYLDALEGGRVEEKLVEDGAMLKRGQPILRLSNTDLELTLANQETAVFEVLTQMQNTKNNAEQNTIRQLNQMAEVTNALEEASRVYHLNKKLYEQKAIGFQDFKSSENLYNYQVRRKNLTEQILTQDSLSTRTQLAQMEESYARMQNALQLMRRKVGDLIVRAPVDGQLTSLDAEIGQSKQKGERLGQLDVLSGYKIRADIDEHYISRVFTGLEGDFTFAGKKYFLKIKKIYTQVTGGRFQVDMEFTGEVPQGIRRGQTLQVGLALGDESVVILVPKGGFFQTTGGNWIFKVNEAGNLAFKQDITLGRQNPNHYEVLSGLKPGDKVVTNSYETYGKMEELVLQR
ncbi:MAG TPA: HlyD family efflux transporter periplasmic adaptor subunit [Saprospiraceae bacterium]|nr:HlyD family efflux transporter periplasmic adaptor subunit [Saprospiraceae bacterium]HNT20455.1 HlyD family efflux transporter periplasmic adaptor subunit [Saprospiraceae bacterium]